MKEKEENIEVNYIDIYLKRLLNEIKHRVQQNHIRLINEEKTDRKMIEVMKDLCYKNCIILSEDKSKQFNMLLNGTENDSERMMCTLLIYYTALFFDNLKLLNRLLEKGYNFGYKKYDLGLYVLDKKISSQFDEEQYINLVLNKSSLFENFYCSLSNTNINMDNDECIKIFSNILKENPNIDIVESSKLRGYMNKEISYLLTKKSICFFGQEIILNATYEQKENIISKIGMQEISKESFHRLINLMKNYNFSMYICGQWEELFKNLTDEEIIMISESGRDILYECKNKQTHMVDYNEVKKTIHRRVKTKRKIINGDKIRKFL